MKQFGVYSAGRLLIFGVVALALSAIGLRGFLLAALAVLLSLPLSYVLLARQRAAFSAVIERRVADRRARRDSLRARLRGDDEAPG